MKLQTIRLMRDPDKSFIIYKENNPFDEWHHHPEYELVLITKGKGKRIVGDQIDRFVKNDLVFLGSYTPHHWLCDQKYFDHPDGFQGEGIVIQFLYNFLGEEFFNVPENIKLKEFLDNASRGCAFYGETKKEIISLIEQIQGQRKHEKLFTLFSIFRILASTTEFNYLASSAYINPVWSENAKPMTKALQYMLENFSQNIQIKDMLENTNMSNTTFFASFKKMYNTSFKDYLLNIRVGWACRLLAEESKNISEIAFDCGFKNISNFNRQFKKIKGITPSQFQKSITGSRKRD